MIFFFFFYKMTPVLLQGAVWALCDSSSLCLVFLRQVEILLKIIEPAFATFWHIKDI